MNFLGLGPGELLLIMVLALIVFGPGKLPEIGQGLGRAVREFRKATDSITREFGHELSLDSLMQEPKPAAAPATEAPAQPQPAPAPVAEEAHPVAAPVVEELHPTTEPMVEETSQPETTGTDGNGSGSEAASPTRKRVRRVKAAVATVEGDGTSVETTSSVTKIRRLRAAAKTGNPEGTAATQEPESAEA